MDNTKLAMLRETNDTTRLSARKTFADSPVEFWASANQMEYLNSSDGFHPDNEGIVAFRQGGHLLIQTQLEPPERFVIDVRLNITDIPAYNGRLRIRFEGFGESDGIQIIALDKGVNEFSVVSPTAPLPDSVAFYIDEVDSSGSNPSAFELVYCDFTKFIE